MSSTPNTDGLPPGSVADLPWAEVMAQLAGTARVIGLRPGQALPSGWPSPADNADSPVVLVAPSTEQDVLEAHQSAGRHLLIVVVANLARPAFVRALLVGEGDQWVPGWLRAALTRRSVDRLLADLGRRQRLPGPGQTVVPTGRPLDDLLAEVAARAGAPDQPWIVTAYEDDGADTTPAPAARPFLSVLLRTQGRRPRELADVLLCLAAQTCADFEVLLLAHDLDGPAGQRLDRLVEDQPAHLRARVVMLPVEGGGRSRPLTVGTERASGRYLAVLDDDDLVLGHWVEEFKAGAQRTPGMIQRSVTVEQAMEAEASALGFRAASWPVARWDVEFSLLSHLVDNHSPVHGCAYPREVFDGLGLGFDESLPVLEDWDLLVRSAALLGVHDSRKVTAVYRRWPADRNSFAHLAAESWPETAWQVAAGWDTHPVLLPAGSATRLRQEGIYVLRHRPIRVRVTHRLDRWRDTWSARLIRTPLGPAVRWAYRRLQHRAGPPA